MATVLEKVEKELNIPREQLTHKEVRRFSEIEIKNLSIEILRVCSKYGVKSFDELWDKLERGEVSEVECLDDLIKLDYLETGREEMQNFLKEQNKSLYP